MTRDEVISVLHQLGREISVEAVAHFQVRWACRRVSDERISAALEARLNRNLRKRGKWVCGKERANDMQNDEGAPNSGTG